MEVYSEEKKKLSNLQSNYHKLLNNLKKYTIKNNSSNFELLLEINNLIDILNSKIIELNENFTLNKGNSIGNLHRINTIHNDNKVIKDLIPILLMYRLLLNP